MTYIVEFAARAARDLEILYMEKNAAESQAAARWYNGLEQAMDALALFPNRFPLAPEARRAKRKLRHLLYGKKPHVYRIIYEVEARRQTVWALTIRHGARRKLKVSTLRFTALGAPQPWLAPLSGRRVEPAREIPAKRPLERE